MGIREVTLQSYECDRSECGSTIIAPTHAEIAAKGWGVIDINNRGGKAVCPLHRAQFDKWMAGEADFVSLPLFDPRSGACLEPSDYMDKEKS